MFGSEQFTDNEKRVQMTTAAAIENAAKQKVIWKRKLNSKEDLHRLT